MVLCDSILGKVWDRRSICDTSPLGVFMRQKRLTPAHTRWRLALLTAGSRFGRDMRQFLGGLPRLSLAYPVLIVAGDHQSSAVFAPARLYRIANCQIQKELFRSGKTLSRQS